MDPAYLSDLDALIRELDRHIDENDENPNGLIRQAKSLESRARSILHGDSRAEEVARHLSRGSASSALGVLRTIRAEEEKVLTYSVA